MSEFDGEPSKTVTLTYDEDEKVEVKYEPFDSELIRESEILRHDSSCVTCQKVIKKITAHLTDHICSSSNDVDGLTEPREYIVDPNYIIKIEPEDDFVNSEPGDVGIMNDTQRPGTHDSRNSRQRQWKVLDFDTGQCSPDCEICKKYLLELREHLAINHPQLQVQPGCAPAPLPHRSTVHGPLKTLILKNTRPHLRQTGKTVDGKYILKVVLTPDMEKQNLLEDTRRKTRTSKRAGYAEESIAPHPSSSKPVKKKSRPNSDPSDQNKNEEIKPTTRVPCVENSDSESKCKEGESEGRSVNEIHTEVESSKLNPTSAVTLRENAESSDSHEINLTDRVPHTGGNQDITQTGDYFIEMSKTAVEGESVMTIHGGRQPETDLSGQEIYQQTETGERQAVIVPAGGRYGKMPRIADKMSHSEENPTKLAQIMSERTETVDTAKLPKLTHTEEKPSMTMRIVEKPASLTRSGGKRKSTKMLKCQILKRLKSLHSKSTSSIPLDNCVVHSDKWFDCSECGESFVTRNTLTLHEKIHKVEDNLLVENCGKVLTEQVSDTGGNSAHTLEEPTRIGGKRENVDTNMVPGEGKLVKMIPAGGELANMTNTGEELENSTRTVEKSQKLTEGVEELENMTSTIVKSPKLTVTGQPRVTVHAGGETTNINRAGGRSVKMYRAALVKLDEMNRTKGEPEKLSCVTGEATTVHTVGNSTEYHTESEVDSGSSNDVRVRLPRKEKRFKCESCGEIFVNEQNLIRHRLMHKEKPCICDVCDDSFTTTEHLRKHKEEMHKDERYKCDVCGKRCLSSTGLTNHKFIHTAKCDMVTGTESQHKCEKCEKHYPTLRGLSNHEYTHTVERQYKCKVCGNDFPRRTSLIIHKLTHTGKKEFKCDVCEKTFSTPSNVIHHDRTHTGENLLQCETCGKFLSGTGNLRRHKILHTGERPFAEMNRTEEIPQKFACITGEPAKRDQNVGSAKQTTHTIIDIESEEGPFKCDICVKSFDRSAGLTLHKLEHIDFRCDECGINLSSTDRLSDHKTHHALGTLQMCVERDKSVKRNYGMTAHVRGRTGQRPFKCAECEKSFSQKCSLDVHMRCHTGEKPFKCTECAKSFSLRGSLDLHVRCHTREKPFKCTECEKSFRQKGQLHCHLRSHTGEKPFRCTECAKSFSQKGSLGLHVRCHTREKPFNCTECEKSFRQKGQFNCHLRSHTGEKPFRCTECAKSFSQKGSLDYHVRCHTREKPFKCTECAKSFSRRGGLDVHMRCHTREQAFKCTECEKSFRQKGQLHCHQRRHTGENPFRCTECAKSFSQKGSLDYHVRCHTREKPFKCTECAKSFSRKGGLDVHMRCHTREQPFKCTECEKSFGQKCNLDYHLITHTGEKTFICDCCIKGFSTKSNLKVHMRNHSQKGRLESADTPP